MRTFIAAAAKENFRAASEALFISQPTVSVHVRQLEEELGAALFERRGRRVRLSAAGRRFLREARRIVEAHDDNLQQFRSWLQGYAGSLTLGVSPLIAASVLPRIVAKFSAAHPEVELRIRIMESFEIEDALSDLLVDVGLSRTVARQRDIAATPLYDDRIVCVVPTADVDMDGPA
ncbi:MAG: LysR family transcriptional regulator, partial [Bacilli bacterium]